jgi:hypothetical protein
MKKKITPIIARGYLLLTLFLLLGMLANSQAVNRSLKFNGTTQYGRVTSNAALQLRSFTIEMWVRPEGSSTASANGSGTSGVLNAYPLLSKGRGESESPAVDVNYYVGINATSNKVGFDFEDDNGSINHPVYSSTPVASCVWQHIAASYNDTTGEWKVYYNGVLDSTKILSTNFHPQSASNVNLSFGTAVNSTNVAEGFFGGSLDEIRIWKRVRTAAEIATNKNLEIPSHTDLAARYDLNEGTGTSAANSSSAGAALNASLFNTPVWNANGFDGSLPTPVGAIDLDGTNDHIAFGLAASLRVTSAFTLEAWIKIEGTGQTTGTGTGGLEGTNAVIPIVAKGRGESEVGGFNMNYLLGIIASTGQLAADFEEASGPNHPVIGNAILQQNKWYHVAATYGPNGAGANEWKLYINGVLDQQKIEPLLAVPDPNSNQHSSIGTAMQTNGSAQGFFNGKIDEVRIWNVARTGTDIANNYLNELGSGTGLIGRWGFNECSGNTASNSVAGGVNGTLTNGALRTVNNYNPPPFVPSNPIPANGATNHAENRVQINVSDRNNQPLTVKLFGRKKQTTAGAKFTIIGLPDTQFYTSHLNGGTNELFKAQTQWIADRRLDSNIVYVTQLGDCVENGNNGGNDIEWKRADTAMKKIENPNVPVTHGIPYSICVGNHDQGTIYDPNSPTTFYNQYFGEARFTGRTYYGGHYGNNNDNSFQLFSAGGIDFIHIALEYNDNDNANGQGSGTDVETLQAVLNWADSLLKAHSNRKAILSTHRLIGTGNPGAWQGGGQKIYDDLKDNPNLFLMLCGHVAGQGRRVDVFNGNTVHTLLSDYQSGYGNGGNGYMRVMQFIPSSNTMTVRTFSPTAGALPNATEIANGNFDLSVNLSPGFSLITTLSNVGAGTIELPWLTLEPLTEYEWYVTASDGEYEETSPVFSFTTAGIVPINLLKFQAHAENKQVKLTWTTAEEVNSSKFEIERSSDGKNFMKIGEQKAAGNSVVLKDYQAFDAKPLRGLNFYRLKMVDADNNHRYSRIVQVSMVDKSKGFDVYPNPVSGDEINIVFADDAKGDAMVKLFDLNGRMRLSTVRAVRNNTLAIKHHLSPGVYIISVRINNKDATRKIIIE